MNRQRSFRNDANVLGRGRWQLVGLLLAPQAVRSLLNLSFASSFLQSNKPADGRNAASADSLHTY